MQNGVEVILLPYVCLDGGEAISDGNAGFAHWCLVFGRYERGDPLPDKRVLAVTWAPPGRVYTKPSQELHRINQLLGVRQETLRAVAYSKTMAHMCVVV